MPWKPGESGNPKGRPKTGLALAEALASALAEEHNGVPKQQLVAQKLVELAMKGDISAIAQVFKRVLGDKVILEAGEGGFTIHVNTGVPAAMGGKR